MIVKEMGKSLERWKLDKQQKELSTIYKIKSFFQGY